MLFTFVPFIVMRTSRANIADWPTANRTFLLPSSPQATQRPQNISGMSFGAVPI
jgi:hypothetical protein